MDDNKVDINEIYYNDLKKYSPYTKEEERELIIKAKSGDIESRNKVLNANLKYVIVIANQYKGSNIPIQELISEGNLGLLYAFDKFDVNKDVKFYCYGVWWIRQFIQNYIRLNKNIYTSDLFEDCKKNLTDDVFTNDEDEYIYTNLNEPMYQDEKVIFDFNGINITSDMVHNLLNILNERERKIISLYYGFEGDEKNLEEVGEIMKLSQERVRQIKYKAMRKLRQEILLNYSFANIYV